MAKRILIVDDDTDIRNIFAEVLSSGGYEVTAASDGEEGLTHLTEGGFDAILLDVMMPKLDGLGVLKKLKETPPKNPNGPILILTNLDHDPVLDEALSLGAKQSLLKADILPPTLLSIVKEATSKNDPKSPQPAQ